MGGARLYRWERRHKRRKRLGALARERKSLYVFQLILLTIIFFLFAIGGRVLPMFAFTQSPCVEAMAYYNMADEGPTLFQGFLTLSGISLLFWVAITISHTRALVNVWLSLIHI